MTDSKLEQAKKLIEQSRISEAQKLLKHLIAADPRDQSAWFWFAETLPTIEQRIESLKICLEYNPDSIQTKEKIAHLESRLGEDQIQAIKINSAPYSKADLYRPKPNPNWVIKLLFLLVASIISALFLYAIEVPVTPRGPGDHLNLLIPMLCVNGLQVILIILAVIGIQKIYFELFPQRPRNKYTYAVLVVVPLLFNLIGANSLMILRARLYISNLFIYNSISITVKDQTISFDSSRSYYHATLHIINNTGHEIAREINGEYWMFWIGDNNSKVSRSGIKQFGADWIEATIPPGESDLIINVPVYRQKCDDSLLKSSLFLQYSAPSTMSYSFRSIQLDDEITRQLKKTACE